MADTNRALKNTKRHDHVVMEIIKFFNLPLAGTHSIEVYILKKWQNGGTTKCFLSSDVSRKLSYPGTAGKTHFSLKFDRNPDITYLVFSVDRFSVFVGLCSWNSIDLFGLCP